MRAIALALALLLFAGQSWAITQFWRPSCANNGDGTSEVCAGAPGGVGAFNTPASLSLTPGNVAYLIGLAFSNWNPGGITGSFNGLYFNLRCDHPAGQGGFSTASGSQIAFGGGSRNGLDIGPRCSFGGGATNGVNVSSSSAGVTNAFVRIRGNDFVGLTSAGIAIEPVQDAINSDIDIYDNSFSNIGASLGQFSSDPGAWTANTAIALNTYRRPVPENGLVYKATTAGTTGGSQPSWNGTVGGTTNDGTVVWTTATPTGEGIRIAPARNASGTASGLVRRVSIFDNTFVFTATGGRYGISAYPCTTCTLAERLTSGRVRNLSVFGNTFLGDYLYHAINLTNDVDDSDVFANSFAGTFGGAVIHVGGQGTYGTCNASSDNNVIRDHRIDSGSAVKGGVKNTFNPADGAGIYADECATGTKILRNEVTGNVLAGIYLNDADNTTAESNVVYGNGDNEVHVHGAGINFLARRNSTFHDATSPSGFADQGTDGWQIDGTVGAGTTLTENIIVCAAGVPKCVDADVAITESFNAIYHPDPTKRAEGFTPAGSDITADPGLVGGLNLFSAAAFCPGTGSPVIGAGTFVGPWILDVFGHDLGNPPNLGAVGPCRGRALSSGRALH